MADTLPRSGISLVVENSQKAIRDLNAFQKALGQQNKAIQSAAANGGISKVFGAVQKDLSGIASKALSSIPGLSRFSATLTETGAAASTMGMGMGAAVPQIALATAAIGAAALAFAGFWKLGTKGAALQNNLEAFGNVVGGLADSTEVLNGLRSATRGTVSDMELMRLSVAALQGQNNEFRSVLLQNVDGVSNLGKVFDITARAARASGQNVEIVREKFLTGLRLQSKLRLDDIGVTVIAEDANRRYAESIGKTADALTDAEKKQAFLNEALRQLDRIGAEAPINRLQDALARIPVVFTNLFDKLALAIQPVFEPIVMVIDTLVQGFSAVANLVIPIIAALANVIGTVLSEAFKTASAVANFFFGGLASGVGTTLTYVVATISLAADGIVALVKFIGEGIRSAIDSLRKALAPINSFFAKIFGSVGETAGDAIKQLAFGLGKGGALVIGSFAAGLLKGGTYVLKAVTAIAQIVADFLMGFSPPKKGVLHNIDKGGENTAIAWTDGFMGGVQNTFSSVTKYVNDRLGAIASFSRDQLTNALARLDLALRPFKENLAIAKADMQAIAGFTDPAMRIMERQRKSLLKAFGRGDKGADIEALRSADRQIQRLKELKELGQDQVDQAELQLALAEGQQAQQRALLQIALDRMGAEQKAAEAAKEAKAPGGSGAAPESGSGTGGGFAGGTAPDLIEGGAIDAAKADILKFFGGVGSQALAGISEGLAQSGAGEALGALKAQSGKLGEQLGRIKDSNPAKAIVDKFATLKDDLSAKLNEVKGAIDAIFKTAFSDPDGTVIVLLNGFKTFFVGIVSGEGSPFLLAQTAITNLVATAQTQFPLLLEAATNALDPIKETFTSFFTGDESPVMLAQQAITDMVTNMSTSFTTLKDNVFNALMSMQRTLLVLFTWPTGAIELAKTAATNMLNHIINQFFRLTNEGEGTLRGALASLGSVLNAALKTPIKDTLSAIAQAVIDVMNGIIKTFNKIPGVPDFDLLPSFQFPELATGAQKFSGSAIVGERGPELVTSAKRNPFSVFPARATRALDMIGTMIQRPAAQPMYSRPAQNVQNSSTVNGSHNNNSYNRNVTQNFRYAPTRLEMRQMEANS